MKYKFEWGTPPPVKRGRVSRAETIKLRLMEKPEKWACIAEGKRDRLQNLRRILISDDFEVVQREDKLYARYNIGHREEKA